MSKALECFNRDSYSRLSEDQYVAEFEARQSRSSSSTVDKFWGMWSQDSSNMSFPDYFDRIYNNQSRSSSATVDKFWGMWSQDSSNMSFPDYFDANYR
jgi:hypothetical protein